MMAKKLQDTDREEEIRQAFKVFDKDGDGFVSKDELSTVMRSLGRFSNFPSLSCHISDLISMTPPGENLSPTELQQMIDEADANGDGKIDYSGSCILLKNAYYICLSFTEFVQVRRLQPPISPLTEHY